MDDKLPPNFDTIFPGLKQYYKSETSEQKFARELMEIDRKHKLPDKPHDKT